MSWKATAYVKELRNGLSVTDKFVLLMLAEYHRTDQKNSWPSVATLSDDCLMSIRGVQQILARLVENDFIRRQIGGGRGNVTAYQIVGLDVVKGEPQTANTGSVNGDSLNETLHSHAGKGERNPAQPCNAIRNEPVLEPVKESNGSETPPDLHPNQYAMKIIQELVMTENRQHVEAVSGAFNLELRLGKSKPAAYEFILAVAKDAQDAGVIVDFFYFRDWGKNRNGVHAKPLNAMDAFKRKHLEAKA
jgi:hypothetical protein